MPSGPDVDHLATMAKALEKNGTTLIYVPLPTKSQVLPELVPARASLYGFDAGIATRFTTMWSAA